MARRALLLLSGGIDSPVAGILAKRAGLEVSAIHFSSEPLVGPDTRVRCEKLAEFIGMPLHTENISKDLERLANSGKYALYFVLQKRLFLRRAGKFARIRGIPALITGDSVGQVSSQTLTNLSVVDSATDLPVIRPLISMDKEETISLARKFGTLELSRGPEACCVLGPKHPATGARLEDILSIEEGLGQGLNRENREFPKNAKSGIRGQFGKNC